MSPAKSSSRSLSSLLIFAATLSAAPFLSVPNALAQTRGISTSAMVAGPGAKIGAPFVEAPLRVVKNSSAHPALRTMLRPVPSADIPETPLPEVDGHPFCPIPLALNQPPRPAAVGTVAVPILNSRPGATAVLYMDFDGEVVTDPAWNNGQTINAASFNLSASEISDIIARVGEDYAGFNLNVTTDLARYNAAPVGKRMRCIVTPTNTAYPGSGGVAYVGSFAQAGTNSFFSSTVPCWVFNSYASAIAEAASHEFGHTLGLSHDGRTTPSEEYFQGQGSGATSWAPIMGVGYYKNVVQWSKGQYQYANNQEDDLAIISGATNGFGYAPDEAGDTPATAAKLRFSSHGMVAQSGVVAQSADADYFAFTTTGGAISLTASPAASSPNLDIALDLRDSAGNVVASSNPVAALSASIATTLAPGNYTLSVRGAGVDDGFTSGYTTYASTGNYTLSGTIPTPPPASSGAILSEFRFRGPGGSADEYVEMLNTTGSPLDVSGWSLKTRTASGFQSAVIPEGTTIPSRGHLLFTGSAYSLSGYGAGDVSLGADALDDSGAALLNAAGAVQDAVGFTTSDASLREGAGLPGAPTGSEETAWMRDFVVSQSKDTSDSSQDFVLVSTTGAAIAGTSGSLAAQLGAPSPEGLSSPSYVNNLIGTTLLDPSVAAGVAPNRVRISGGGTLGTLIVRRTIKNLGTRPLARIRFGITSISSLNSAGYASSAQADVRLVSAPDETVTLANGTTTVAVSGTTLDAGGAGQAAQPQGGGLGSSLNLTTVALATPLMPGEVRNYAFRVQIERGGNYYIYFNFLALPG